MAKRNVKPHTRHTKNGPLKVAAHVIVTALTSEQATVLQAVQQHPGIMSPILLEYVLRGDVIGRMAEKGLLQSPFHGALQGATHQASSAAIKECLAAGWVVRERGFYPALNLTDAGRARLV